MCSCIDVFCNTAHCQQLSVNELFAFILWYTAESDILELQAWQWFQLYASFPVSLTIMSVIWNFADDDFTSV